MLGMAPLIAPPAKLLLLPPVPQVGLDVWLRDGNVFKCWRSMWDVIWHGELGSSLALLNAGATKAGAVVGCVRCGATCLRSVRSLARLWCCRQLGSMCLQLVVRLTPCYAC